MHWDDMMIIERQFDEHENCLKAKTNLFWSRCLIADISPKNWGKGENLSNIPHLENPLFCLLSVPWFVTEFALHHTYLHHFVNFAFLRENQYFFNVWVLVQEKDISLIPPAESIADQKAGNVPMCLSLIFMGCWFTPACLQNRYVFPQKCASHKKF